MINKIYPRDQIKQYLLIDVAAVVFLSYIVLSSSALGLLEDLFLLLIFLASFYMALWHTDWRLLAACMAGIATLSVLGIYTGPSILLFGFIFADLLGRARSKWHIGIGMVAIALMFFLVPWKSEGAFFTPKQFVLLPVMILQMVFPVLIYIKERNKSLQGELDAANQQIQHYIQQEERQRIARDLHDTLGQTLTMIKMKSELAARLIDHNPVHAKKELKDILDTSRTALKQVREVVSDMKFISLESEWEHSRHLLQTAGIELEIKGRPPLLSSVEETMLALSVREAMTNIVKHSRAKRCIVEQGTTADFYYVRIIDDGVGLVHIGGGNGIQSMKERMKGIGGDALVENGSGGGTTVVLKIPVRHEGKGKPAS
jgi:two-component system sensor histidine kinase DesK